ncbi:MAG: hypothetical protein V3U88_01355 [Methylococcales bacterium]
MEKSTPFTRNYQALDFTSYQQLRAKPHHANQLIASYQKTFSEPDVWAEDYSYEEVDQKLKNELAGDAYLRIVIDEKKQNQVAAFCWAQLLNADEILTSIRSIQYYQTIGEPDLSKPLYDIIGDDSILYLHDLAITEEYRGKVNLQKLILPVLQDIATRTGISTLFFWSVEGTRISSLANRAGIDLVTTSNGIQFFKGNIRLNECNSTQLARMSHQSCEPLLPL